MVLSNYKECATDSLRIHSAGRAIWCWSQSVQQRWTRVCLSAPGDFFL